MKGSKFLIVGSLVVAGIIAYGIYKHFHNEKGNLEGDTPKAKGNSGSIRDTNPSADSYVASAADINETKETVVASAKVRRYEAAKAMEESLNTIFKENEDENIVTENSEVLVKTRSNLDDLLK